MYLSSFADDNVRRSPRLGVLAVTLATLSACGSDTPTTARQQALGSTAIAIVGGVNRQGLPRQGDADMMSHLTARGFTPVLVDCLAPASATEGAQLVILSASCRSIDVGSRYADDPRPVLVSEPGVYGPMYMGAGVRNVDFDKEPSMAYESGQGKPLVTQLQITRTDHPVVGDLLRLMGATPPSAPFPVDVYSQPHAVNWELPVGDAVVLATVIGAAPPRASLFVFERGSAMLGGVRAPARRVGFFEWHTDDYLPDLDIGGKLSDRGWALFDGSVSWALGDTRPALGDLRKLRAAHPWHVGPSTRTAPAITWVPSPAWALGVRAWLRRDDDSVAALDATNTLLYETIGPADQRTTIGFRVPGGAAVLPSDSAALALALREDFTLSSVYARADYPPPPAN